MFQIKDSKLKKLIKSYPNRFKLKKFHGGGTVRNIVTVNLGVNAGKIVVPESLQLPLTEWYHNTLCHPGETRTEMTIKQHFWWRGLTTTVRNVCSKCVTCQTTKRTHNSKYGQLPGPDPLTSISTAFWSWHLFRRGGRTHVSINHTAAAPHSNP